MSVFGDGLTFRASPLVATRGAAVFGRVVFYQDIWTWANMSKMLESLKVAPLLCTVKLLFLSAESGCFEQSDFLCVHFHNHKQTLLTVSTDAAITKVKLQGIFENCVVGILKLESSVRGEVQTPAQLHQQTLYTTAGDIIIASSCISCENIFLVSLKNTQTWKVINA